MAKSTLQGTLSLSYWFVAMSAGLNIRLLAWRRRWKSIQCYVAALVCSVLLFQVGTLKLPPALRLPVPLLQCGCLVLVFGFTAAGIHYWRRAGHADQGAASEAAIAGVLKPLKATGWRLEYGLRDSRVGDIDVVLIAPSGRGYTLDVKSHGGLVKVKDGQLYRQYGKQSYPFEKDFLAAARLQADVLRDRKGLRHVTPAIVFSKATVAIKKPLNGVQVWSKANLLERLQQLESSSGV